MVDFQENSFGQIRQLLEAKRYSYITYQGEQIFQHGDGFWIASKNIKVTYAGGQVRLEAWVGNMNNEMALDGIYGGAVKSKLKKLVPQVEKILQTPNPDYVPEQAEPDVQEEAEAPKRYCRHCGAPMTPGGAFCPGCGMSAQESAAPAQQLPEGITKKEFIKHYAGDAFARQLRGAAILGYICAGLNAAVSMLSLLNGTLPLGLVDSVIMLGLTLGMHLGKSKVCAILMLIYAVFTVVVGLVLSGTFSGWLWIVAGVYAVITFANVTKRYKKLTGK